MIMAGPTDAVGGTCSWDLPRMGCGRISHTRITAPSLIEQRMSFAQPFRFRGRARWRFAERDGRTEVTWSMRGRVGFSMRAFAKTVQGMIALDFRYGLDRLAAAVEPKAARTYSITYLGEREIPAARYAYVPYRGPLAGLAAAVPKGIASARAQLGAAGVAECGDPVAIYVKTNVKLQTTECHIGLAVADGATGPLPVHAVPGHRAYVVRLQGSLTALEIAWYQAMQRLRVENIEPDLRVTPFERYVTDPTAVPDAECVTELHIALRQRNPPPPPKT
jgi:hypothetical protein